MRRPKTSSHTTRTAQATKALNQPQLHNSSEARMAEGCRDGLPLPSRSSSERLSESSGKHAACNMRTAETTNNKKKE